MKKKVAEQAEMWGWEWGDSETPNWENNPTQIIFQYVLCTAQ